MPQVFHLPSHTINLKEYKNTQFYILGCKIGCLLCNLLIFSVYCGETGIRTLGARKGTTVFETAPIDHSGISPLLGGQRLDAAKLQFYFFYEGVLTEFYFTSSSRSLVNVASRSAVRPG